jgi:iron complex outermembrane receptor protein
LITAVAFAGVENAWPAETPAQSAEVQEVTVTAGAPESLTSASPVESAKQETQVPGGFAIKTADEMKLGRASSVEDLPQRAPAFSFNLKMAPSLQDFDSRFGDRVRRRAAGCEFLLDCLNYNQGDGEAILEDFDVATLSHAEIFRDADALKYGALTLGGAINLVLLTGHDAAPFQVLLEGGNYGYFRGQISGGAVDGLLDQFGSIDVRERDGFREHSRKDTEILFADLGYKLSEQVENRFYRTLDRTGRNLQGGITKSEMQDAPSQANPLAIAQDWDKE